MSQTKLKLETKTGTLEEIFPLFDPSTIQHADQLTDERCSTEDQKERDTLRSNYLWTGDFPVYGEKKPTLYLARLPQNLFFRHFPESITQLLSEDNYLPNPDEMKEVISADATLELPLKALELKKHDDEFSFFEINTLRPNLSPDRKRFAQRVYSKGNFDRNMKMLYDAKIKETRAWVLNPDYVASKTEGGIYIARVARLGSFAVGSRFSADDRYVNYPVDSLRGVLKTAEGSSPKKPPTLREILKISSDFVPNVALDKFEEQLRRLYE